MCGLAGFLRPEGLSEHDARKTAIAMANRLAHRGPDDSGAWVDPESGIALSHRRLSIIDLSAAGHQPMMSSCGRYMISFNGEIYNHLEIRRTIEVQSPAASSHRWRGHSDTETLLEAIAALGIQKTLESTVGMFAFAVWDRSERQLYLARDRFGEKPLYYGLVDRVLVFASQLDAIRAYPGFSAEIDRQAIAQVLRLNAVPTPNTIYRGIHKLVPGTFLRLTPGEIAGRELPLPNPYWSLREVAQAGQNHPFKGDERAATEELDHLLRQAVAGQMIADVPLGAFLSGGIDSSTIVALMQNQASQPVKTFTIGFHEDGYDEAAHARRVARHLGTDHTELYIAKDEALSVIPRLPAIYDEPFADVSQIPTVLVSELARRHVTVSLSGDGGDELFGGYNRYVGAMSIWRKISWMPAPARMALAGALTSVSTKSWNWIFSALRTFLPGKWNFATPGEQLHKVSRLISVRTPEEIYDRLISNADATDRLVRDALPNLMLFDRADSLNLKDIEHRMMYLDALSYLPDDVLTKVDRAAMSVSLETRVPFLDHRIAEFAWRLPLNQKIQNGNGKLPVRRVLDRYVPQSLIDRPKAGFAAPIESWLRGGLRDWAETLIDPATLAQQGYLEADGIRNAWNNVQATSSNVSHLIWAVLMFQAWLVRESECRSAS